MRFVNEGKRWPEDYVKSATNKLVIRYGLQTQDQIDEAKAIVMQVKDALDFISHDGKLYSLLDKTILWICDNVSDFNGIRLFLVKNLGMISRGLEVMTTTKQPQWSAEAIKKMDFQTFKQQAEEAQKNVVIDADPTGKTYTVVPIQSFTQLNRKYGGYVTGAGIQGDWWCHANGMPMYNDFTDNGRCKMYVIAQDGWESIEAPDPSDAVTAYDDYGMSLIAIAVDIESGTLVDQTLRWNHVVKPSNGQVDNAFDDDWSKLNAAVGFNVEEAVDRDLQNEKKLAAQREADPHGYVQSMLAKTRIVGSDFVPLDIRAKIREVIVPPNVSQIDEYAFRDCIALEKIVVPSTVKSIGDLAFYNCVSLADVKLNEGLAEISIGAFSRCSSLESIVIPASVRIVRSQAFNACISLKEVTIAGPSTDISPTAFTGTDLQKLDFLRVDAKRIASMHSWPFGVDPSIIHGREA